MARPQPHGKTERRACRWTGGLALAVATTTLTAAALTRAAPSEPLEAAVKAAYLYKFTSFVAWPDSAFPDPSSPFTLCVEGEDPFGALLDRAVAGQSVGTHPVEVRRQPSFADGAGCHLLYTTSAVDRPRGRPVLTITDAASGGTKGAVITFILQDDRVRFEINADAARDNRLTISSKLLSLAVGVRRQ